MTNTPFWTAVARHRFGFTVVILLALSLHTAQSQSQSQLLISLTNQVWRYNQTGADLAGTGWHSPGYLDDETWPEGRSVLARENNFLVTPYINTVLNIGPITYYFRTHFQFDGDPSRTYLVASNLIDDGYIMYLNGVPVSGYNLPAGEISGNTHAIQNTPLGEGVYVVRELPAASLRSGDNVLAVEVHQAISSTDVVWGTVLHATPMSVPRFLSPTNDATLYVMQGRTTNLTVRVEGTPPPILRWFIDNEPLTSTSTVHQIVNMSLGRQGIYRCQARNSVGTNFSPAFDVRYEHDDVFPELLSVKADPFDLYRVIAYFSEPVTNADELFNYSLHNASGDPLNLSTATYNPGHDQVVLVTELPLDRTQQYSLTCNGDIWDLYENPLMAPVTLPVIIPHAFRDEHLGYMGTLDTELRETYPDLPIPNEATITADLVAPNVAQGLLRFENIVGNSPFQLPPCAFVSSATLRLYTVDVGDPIRLLRLHVPWADTDTWNSMQNGIDQTNGVETGVTDAIIFPNQTMTYLETDVTAAVKSWTEEGEPNHGWAFLSTGPNGWGFASSDTVYRDLRPALFVQWYNSASPCSILQQPRSTNVFEGQPFSLFVTGIGSRLAYQWYRNNTPIPNATNASYHVAQATQSNNGSYHVVVQSQCSGTCVSQIVTVTVRCPPDLRITYNADQTVTVSRSLCAGSLYEAESLNGPWTLISLNTNRFTFSTSGNSRFFKLVP